VTTLNAAAAAAANANLQAAASDVSQLNLGLLTGVGR